jgi:hypothetical protein
MEPVITVDEPSRRGCLREMREIVAYFARFSHFPGATSNVRPNPFGGGFLSQNGGMSIKIHQS